VKITVELEGIKESTVQIIQKTDDQDLIGTKQQRINGPDHSGRRRVQTPMRLVFSVVATCPSMYGSRDFR
jgi:hypothetical protein